MRYDDDEDDMSANASLPKVLVPKSKDSRSVDLATRLFLDRTIYLGTAIDNTVHAFRRRTTQMSITPITTNNPADQ